MSSGVEKEAGNSNYKCFWCNFRSHRCAELMSHIKQFHADNYEETCNSGSSDEYRCMWCQENFAQLSNLMTHIKRKHKEHYFDSLRDKQSTNLNYRCFWCEQKYHKLSFLMSHIQSVHPENYAEAQNEKGFEKSHKELIMREAMLGQSSSPLVSGESAVSESSSKNNNETEKPSVIVNSENSSGSDPSSHGGLKRSSSFTESASEPKKFKKPRLHALDDITKEERNPPELYSSEINSRDSLSSEGSHCSTILEKTDEMPKKTESNATIISHLEKKTTVLMSQESTSSTPSPKMYQSSLPSQEVKAVVLPSNPAGDRYDLANYLHDTVNKEGDKTCDVPLTGGSPPLGKYFPDNKEHDKPTLTSGADSLVVKPRGRPSKLATLIGLPGMDNLESTAGSTRPHHNTRPSGEYKCFWCDQVFRMRGRLMDHIEQQHKTSKEQQSEDAAKAVRNKYLTDTAGHDPIALMNGWQPNVPTGGSSAWPHSVPIPGYFFPQYNGLGYNMYPGRSSGIPQSQQPSFPSPVPVSLPGASDGASVCKYFKLGNSKTRLTSCRIRASDILRKENKLCKFYYLRLRDCNSVFARAKTGVEVCLNGHVSEEEPMFHVDSFRNFEEPPDFFRHPIVPGFPPPWMSQERRSSMPAVLPIAVRNIKQEPMDDFQNFAAFAQSSRYGRRGSLPLDLRSRGHHPALKIERPREYPM